MKLQTMPPLSVKAMPSVIDEFRQVSSTEEQLTKVTPKMNSTTSRRPNNEMCEIASNSSSSSGTITSMHRRHRSLGGSHRSSTRNSLLPKASALNANNSLADLEKVLSQHGRKFGERHATVGAVLNLIGNFHFRQGNLMAAFESYKKAVECDAGDHTPVGHSNLGTVYWSMGDLGSAQKHLQEALKAYSTDLKLDGRSLEDSSKVATVYHQLGLCHALRGDVDGALDSLGKARRIRQRLLGQNDVSVGQTLDAIGKVHFMQGNYKRALNLHEEALVILRASSKPTVTTLQNIAAVHTATGEYKAALAIQNEVLKQQMAELNLSNQNPLPSNHRAAKAVDETFQAIASLKKLTSQA